MRSVGELPHTGAIGAHHEQVFLLLGGVEGQPLAGW
jgi:hypothetical protein